MKVDWVEDPPAWLLPVKVVLSKAVEDWPGVPADLLYVLRIELSSQSRAQIPERSITLDEQLDLPSARSQVSIESRAAMFSKLESKIWSGQERCLLVASPAQCVVSLRPILNWDSFRCLQRRGLYNPLVLMLCLIAMTLHTMQTGSRTINASVSTAHVSEAMQDVTFVKKHPLNIFFLTLVSCIGWVALAHRIPRAIFSMTVITFECLILLVSRAAAETVVLYNDFKVAAFLEENTFQWMFCEIAYRVLVTMLVMTVIACGDAVRMKACLKITLYSLTFLFQVYSYVKARWLSTGFIDEEVCAFLFCGRPRSIYAMCVASVVILVAKFLFGCLRGRTCVVIHPHYDLVVEMEDSGDQATGSRMRSSTSTGTLADVMKPIGTPVVPAANNENKRREAWRPVHA